MKSKGIWFYGLSGVGKSYISKLVHKHIRESVVVDGDLVRKLVSFDLKYGKSDREIQVKRVFGIAKLIIESKKYPVISTVWMNKEIIKKCAKANIAVCMVERDISKIIKNHKTYKNKKDVVGVDINYEKLNTKKLVNLFNKSPWNQLKKLI